MTLKNTLSAIALAACVATPAMADNHTAKPSVSSRSPIELFGETLVFFLPDWVDGKDVAEAVAGTKLHRKQNETVFLLEMTPSDQTLADWRDLQAVLAQRGDVSVEQELDTIEANFRAGCVPDVTAVIRSDKVDEPPTDGSGYATVFCGAYVDDPKRGEIGAFRVVRKGEVTARVYREWKGPAFDPGDRDSFPVDLPKLQEINARLLATDFQR